MADISIDSVGSHGIGRVDRHGVMCCEAGALYGLGRYGGSKYLYSIF